MLVESLGLHLHVCMTYSLGKDKPFLEMQTVRLNNRISIGIGDLCFPYLCFKNKIAVHRSSEVKI